MQAQYDLPVINSSLSSTDRFKIPIIVSHSKQASAERVRVRERERREGGIGREGGEQ
jgi:hypothetical protein